MREDMKKKRKTPWRTESYTLPGRPDVFISPGGHSYSRHEKELWDIVDPWIDMSAPGRLKEDSPFKVVEAWEELRVIAWNPYSGFAPMKNGTEGPLKTVPLEEITFLYICEKLDYNPVTGAGAEKYELPDRNDWACDDRPRRWDILTYTEKAWTWGYIAYNKEAGGGKASPSGWGDPEWEAGYLAAMRDTEEELC